MELLQKIESKEAKIGIVGLGYVGLPLLMEFVEQEYKTIGFDVDDKKVVALNKGQSYIKHIADGRIATVVESGLFSATADFSRIPEVDCILICVPTPLTQIRFTIVSHQLSPPSLPISSSWLRT